MKKNNARFVGKFRRVLATAFACIVVVGVPLLSLNQYGHVFARESRSASTLPEFQPRAVDQNKQPYYLFEEPLISVTFDDGWEVTYDGAMPLLQKYGIHSTQYILSGVEENPEYLSWSQVNKIKEAGHEIGCHTDTHPDLKLLDDGDIMAQLTACNNKVYKETGVSVKNFASPYGSADERTLTEIRKMYKSQRNTNGDSSNGVTEVDVNLRKNFNRYNIIGMTVKRDTSPQEIQALVDFAIKNNGWLVLTYHQADDGGSKYGIDTKNLEAQLQVLNRSSARIVTVDQALNSLEQKLEF